MKVRPSRLTLGDYLLGGGGIVLLVSLFALTWYQAPPQVEGTLLLMGQSLSHTGFQTFMWTGLLCVLVGLLALAEFWLQLTHASPAVPIVTAIVLAPLSLLLSLVLVVRVLIVVPSVQLPAGASAALDTCDGSYIGLAAALVITAGAWLSLRRDGVDPADSSGEIETVALARPPRRDPA
jgi:hypothetical protein